LRWLSDIGILKPLEPGRFRPGDLFRAKMIKALLDAGFTDEQIEWGASEGTLTLDHVDRYLLVGPAPRSRRTFAEFSAEVASRPSVLPSLYKVLGLPEPDPSSPVDVFEEALLEQFLRGWQLAGDEETLTRAARLIGQGTRLSFQGSIDLFQEQVAGPAQERLLRGEPFPAEVSRASTLLIRLLPRMMAWLVQRYMEQVLVAGIVEGFEAVLAARGLAPAPQPAVPPAIVFADLSGYTRLTDEQGDEVAVRAAASLQERAEAVAGERTGRLVKLLGDGAMLYFPDPVEAVEGALDLVASMTTDLGIPAHAGIHVGTVIERDRDLFGRTVNLAFRIAGTAGPGEVVVSDAVVRAVPDGRLHFEPTDEARLKGVAEPIPLYRASGSSP
jgi:class 3 adenylate cyclase